MELVQRNYYLNFLRQIFIFSWKKLAKKYLTSDMTNAQPPPRCLDETWTSVKYSELIFSNHCVENSSSHKYWWFPTLPFLKTIYCPSWLEKVNKLPSLDLKVCREARACCLEKNSLWKHFAVTRLLNSARKFDFPIRLFGRRRFFLLSRPKPFH